MTVLRPKNDLTVHEGSQLTEKQQQYSVFRLSGLFGSCSIILVVEADGEETMKTGFFICPCLWYSYPGFWSFNSGFVV
eukprot:scaffold170117_cov46-Cyclotella_meneghiniana.AAC.1